MSPDNDSIYRILAIQQDMRAQQSSDETREEEVYVTMSEANVTVPPTAVQLSAEFGSPSVIGDGFLGIINDNGADVDVYLVCTAGGKWGYIKFTML